MSLTRFIGCNVCGSLGSVKYPFTCSFFTFFRCSPISKQPKDFAYSNIALYDNPNLLTLFPNVANFRTNTSELFFIPFEI